MKPKIGSTISIFFADSTEIRKLNKKYRNKNYPTDVLSFNFNEDLPNGKRYIGDIVINCDLLENQAKENDHSVEEEIAYLASHGVLHLLGVHHKGDE